MTERYRFGGPIPESVQRLKDRRSKREVRASERAPITLEPEAVLVELRAMSSNVQTLKDIAMDRFSRGL